MMITIYQEMSLTYTMMNRYDDALSTIQLALNLEKKLIMDGKKDTNLHLDMIRHRAVVLFGLVRYELAIQSFNESIDLTKRLIGEGKVWIETDLIKDYLNRGTAFERLRKYQLAIQDFSELLDILSRKALQDNHRDTMFIADAYSRRANSYMNLKMFSEANADVVESFTIVKQMLDIQFIGTSMFLKVFCMCVEINLKALMKYGTSDENKAVLKNVCSETLPIVEKNQLNQEAIMWLKTAMKMLHHSKRYFHLEERKQISDWLTEINTILERNEALTHTNTQKVGRNEPCPCGSGKKFKNCCGKK